MLQRVSSILFLIIIFTTLSTHIALADQTKDTSFFSFLKTIVLTYTTTALSEKQILAAHTVAVTQSLLEITPTPQLAPQLSTVSAYILQGVNDYRASVGLSPVQSNAQTCAFAQTRAQEISKSFTHDGFYSRVDSHTIPYTQWAHATENIAEAPDYKEVVTLWKNSPEHAANMRDNTPYVCIMQYGAYYAYEGMRL